MDLSLLLAKIFGIYLLVVGLSILFNREYYKRLVSEVSKGDGLLIYFGGAVDVLLGLLLVLVHNVWVADWRVIITVIAWLVLVKGLFYVLFPRSGQQFIKSMSSGGWYMICAVIALVAGAYLTYVSFFML